MIDRIIRAITFKTDVYREVAADPSFTMSAWIIIAVAQFCNQLGARASLIQYNGFGSFLGGIVVGTLAGVAGVALGVFVISWLAKALFNVNMTFEQFLRPLGLANVFSVVGILGILSAISLSLACITTPISLVVGILGFVAYLMALQKVTGLDWGKVAVLAVAAFIIIFIFSLIVGSIFAVSAFAALY